MRYAHGAHLQPILINSISEHNETRRGGERKLLKSVNEFKHKGDNGSESGLKLMSLMKVSDEQGQAYRGAVQWRQNIGIFRFASRKLKTQRFI